MQETKTAKVIDLFEKPKPEPYCSFCKRKKSEVKMLFSNNQEGMFLRNICDCCIVLAKKKISEGCS